MGGGRALTEQGFGVTLVLEFFAGGELQPGAENGRRCARPAEIIRVHNQGVFGVIESKDETDATKDNKGYTSAIKHLLQLGLGDALYRVVRPFFIPSLRAQAKIRLPVERLGRDVDENGTGRSETRGSAGVLLPREESDDLCS